MYYQVYVNVLFGIQWNCDDVQERTLWAARVLLPRVTATFWSNVWLVVLYYYSRVLRRRRRWEQCSVYIINYNCTRRHPCYGVKWHFWRLWLCIDYCSSRSTKVYNILYENILRSGGASVTWKSKGLTKCITTFYVFNTVMQSCR